MKTVINEPKLVQDLNTEYYKLINLYDNVKRASTFVKYYNISEAESPKNEVTKEVYDYYSKTRSFWDVYESTPTQIVSAIQNSPDNSPDLKGQMIVSATTITTYTIPNPRIGDLIVFYKPAEADEVLRVMNVRLQLNSNFSSEPVRWYELDLETAPIAHSQLDNLLKKNHYVYDLTIEKNVEYNFYKKYVEAMNELKTALQYFSSYYSHEKDWYVIGDEVPREVNELIFFIKQNFNNNYARLFEDIPAPFGYWDRCGKFKYDSIFSMGFNKTKEFTMLNCDRETITREINLSTVEVEVEVHDCLMKTIELLNYINTIGEYIEHIRP